MSRLGDRWVKALVHALGDKDPALLRCPRCGSTGLEVRGRVEVPDSRLGWCVIRCRTCTHGLWFSRMEVPERFETDEDPADWPSTVLD